jgi:signal recognition particle receptor subunit beta
MTVEGDHPGDNARMFQTTIRESITPYLPPPVIKAIREIDPRLEPFFGPDASVSILGSVLMAWCLFQILTKTIFSSGSSSLGGGNKNTAIQEDDRDKDILPSDADTSRPFDETILLCGPSLAGKTSLFYRLLQQHDGKERTTSVGTVRSIKSNTGFLECSPTADNAAGTTLRILDTPGHWGPQKLLRAAPLQDVQRLVVVIDSTQPVASAADYLHAILKTSSLNVLIACHKSDHPKAKNARRIKLQLRSELIRLSKLSQDSGDATDDWEEILNAVPLCSSAVGDLMTVKEFCETGKVLSVSKKR